MKKILLAMLLASVSAYSLAADKQQVTVSLTSANTMAQVVSKSQLSKTQTCANAEEHRRSRN